MSSVGTVVDKWGDSNLVYGMKKVESAVRNIGNGRPAMNKDAIGNPQSLACFEKFPRELQSPSRSSHNQPGTWASQIR